MKRSSIIVLTLVLSACGAGPGDGGQPDGGTTGDGDGGQTGPLRAVVLPQAIDGAMRANPIAQPTITLRIATEGVATKVVVRIDETDQRDAAADGAGGFQLDLDIATLGEGEYTLRAIGSGVDATTQEASAVLVLGNTGRQLTSVAIDGNAGTPRLHARGDQRWLTWTDGVPTRRVWTQRLDGAGRPQGERIELVTSTEDILYARAAFGKDSVAVLMQTPGGPYTNAVTIRDLDGGTLLEPIPLDPEGSYGSFGGDIQYDGDGFVLVWRVNDGAGGGEVRWMRIDESDRTITGPIPIARSGNGNPDGGFSPFSFIRVAPVGESSVVSFTRDRWDATLELAIPRCQVAVVDRAGLASGATEAAVGGGFFYHHECRAFSRDDHAVVLWGAADLTSAEDEPPTGFYRTATDTTGALPAGRGNGTLEISAPLHRSEVHLVGATGELAWLDERSYVDLLNGRIQLYTAPLGGGDEVVFPHARFISGTSELGGIGAGTNTMLVWIDERHGGGITDPRPELWFDTVWR
ncbi:MAG TPA: hypothetical protein VML75_16360 [Kofleriaceae bacterium]|nr:hypothetical protein [Kofleriaceae bacterium]